MLNIAGSVRRPRALPLARRLFQYHYWRSSPKAKVSPHRSSSADIEDYPCSDNLNTFPVSAYSASPQSFLAIPHSRGGAGGGRSHPGAREQGHLQAAQEAASDGEGHRRRQARLRYRRWRYVKGDHLRQKRERVEAKKSYEKRR